ncbi:GGDEF domain-containing protein [Phaeovulum sp.]|uniref:GGDEF domain-containing protein n=1 Tax=Phaeovulum sp. TaxID=2934796 RepID=UPI003562130A
MNQRPALSVTPNLSLAALGKLMPMHLWLGPAGEIRAVGPTLGKICGGAAGLIGQPFDAHFTVASAPGRAALAALRDGPGGRVHLSLRRPPVTNLRGVVLACRASGENDLFLNLSFGAGVAEAVRDHALTAADFAPTDLALELLYLHEAKSAVMRELSALNARLQLAQQAAEAQALCDPLTGLANRRALERELTRSTAEAMRGGSAFAIAQIDLDHFKAINDTLGHAAGDFVLTHVADILRAETRQNDLVARLGGDEFVLLLRGAIEPDQLRKLGERVIARLEAPFYFEGAACRISASIGVALSRCYGLPDGEQIFTDADAALYAAKRAGRGRCVISYHGSDAQATPPPPTPAD